MENTENLNFDFELICRSAAESDQDYYLLALDSDFPDEMIQNIFKYLGTRDLRAVSLTNRKFDRISSEILTKLKKVFLEKIQNYLQQEFPFFCDLCRENNADVSEINEFIEIDPKSTKETYTVEQEDGTVKTYYIKDCVDNPELSLAQRGSFVARNVLETSTWVGEKSYSYLGNTKGVVLIGGGALAIGTGTVPMFLAALPDLLCTAEELDILYDAYVAELNDVKECSSWIAPLVWNVACYILPHENKSNLPNTKHTKLEHIYKLKQKIETALKHVEELDLSFFEKQIKIIGLSKFIYHLKNSCPELKKVILPNDIGFNTVLEIIMNYPDLTFVAQKIKEIDFNHIQPDLIKHVIKNGLFEFVEKLCNVCPELNKIILPSYIHCIGLLKFIIDYPTIAFVAPEVREIDFSQFKTDLIEKAELLKMIVSCPELTKIKLPCNTSSDVIKEIIENHPHLMIEVLNQIDMSGFSTKVIESRGLLNLIKTFIQSDPNLLKIILPSHTESGLLAVIKEQYPNLQFAIKEESGEKEEG